MIDLFKIQSVNVKEATQVELKMIIDRLYQDTVGLSLKSKQFIDKMYSFDSQLPQLKKCRQKLTAHQKTTKIVINLIDVEEKGPLKRSDSDSRWVRTRTSFKWIGISESYQWSSSSLWAEVGWNREKSSLCD